MKTITKLLIAFVALILALLNSSCEKNDLVFTDNNTYQEPKPQQSYTPPTKVDEEIPGEFIERRGLGIDTSR